jgi:methylated-DNA-[protein]-cysteine S-methyltransferase
MEEQGSVCALDFDDHRSRLRRVLTEHYGEYELLDAPSPNAVETRLRRYFAGDLAALTNVQVNTDGDELQRQVWAALRAIPAGKVTTYGALARDLGYTDPRMAIEIGAVIGANPIAIVVPCHRVIGADGDLKGYAWGLHRKRWLLQHEGATIQREAAQAPLEFQARSP